MNESGEIGRIELGKDVTIQHADKLKSFFQDALSKLEKLEIDMNQVDQADLSLLQLLVALDKSATEKGKTLEFIGSCPGALSELIKSTGFRRSKIFDSTYLNSGDN